jgi:hypothetical protein
MVGAGMCCLHVQFRQRYSCIGGVLLSVQDINKEYSIPFPCQYLLYQIPSSYHTFPSLLKYSILVSNGVRSSGHPQSKLANPTTCHRVFGTYRLTPLFHHSIILYCKLHSMMMIKAGKTGQTTFTDWGTVDGSPTIPISCKLQSLVLSCPVHEYSLPLH